ncbi:unnamed protein product [Oppiella nova]|uniref:ADAM10 cysteine-rich domain-containing protein n=1 Tax=Oppiella nova TaxID=334625 RepID=A0A7R9M3G5_9ACAR|nr:unnamed protein product [Oppiella nova]CAG2170054.1 unnamed protein product [Oppiella nova]
MAYGLESCQCRRGPNDPMTKSCELCCRLPSKDSTCKSSFEWNSVPYDVPDLYAKAGTPCDNYNGYCDAFQKCREVDPSGPLATLRRLLLSNESMASLKRWFNEQWFYVAILCLITLLIVAILVKVFGKRTIDLSKSDLVDVDMMLEAAKQHKRTQTATTSSSSLSSINGLSRSALQVQNHGNLVKTSLAYHQQQQQQLHQQQHHEHIHPIPQQSHHMHHTPQHPYYSSQALHQQTHHQIYADHHYISRSNSSLSHMNNIEYNNINDCPQNTFTGNGWV